MDKMEQEHRKDTRRVYLFSEAIRILEELTPLLDTSNHAAGTMHSEAEDLVRRMRKEKLRIARTWD